MNWYNLVFYHIFKRYYKDGKYKNDIPWLTVSVIMGMSSFLYVLNGLILSNYFVNKNILILNKNPIIILAFVFVIINFLWFTKNKRYLSIYDYYKTSKLDNRRTEILAWLYIIFGFAFVFITIFIIH